MHADQAKTDFLGRNEFYNALRLVTVAQSKRDLTPDIVKAALYGPAAAKIPPPQINLAAIPPPRPSAVAAPAPSAVPMGVTAPTSTQSLAYRGQGLAGPVANPQYFPSQQGPTMRPPQSMPMPAAGGTPRPQQGVAGPDISRGINMAGHNFSNPSISNDWNSGRTDTVPSRPAGITQSVALTTPTSPSPVPPLSQPTTPSTRALAISGNGYTSNSVLGNDLFSAASSTPKQGPTGQNYSVSSAPASSAIVPVSSGVQPASKQSSLDSFPSAFSMQLTNSQLQRPQSSPNTSQQISPPVSSPLTSSGIAVGLGNTNSDNSQPPWPKMKPSDVQKYTKVFMEVDTDRDGRITGEQARSLFLSWRLPIGKTFCIPANNCLM